MIQLSISKPKFTIIDVGGATGKYAEWLAKNGHEVHLIEPVLMQVKLAEKRAQKFCLKNGIVSEH